MRLVSIAAFGFAICATTACISVSNARSIDKEVLIAGERAFQKCYSCHSLADSDATTQGPSLRKLIGRAVASDTRYDYSPAMRAYASKQPVWTKRALNDFIADPQALVPENEMGFFGIVDPAERRALIEYLSTK